MSFHTNSHEKGMPKEWAALIKKVYEIGFLLSLLLSANENYHDL
jgi:hypothetical protein